jgi:hypothetical protein
MREVQEDRLSKGQSFATRKILLLRVKEEANLRGISIRIEKSDAAKLVCWSRETADFYVFARQSYGKSYSVVTAIVRAMDGDASWDGEIYGFGMHPLLAAEGGRTAKGKKPKGKKGGKRKTTASAAAKEVVGAGEQDKKNKQRAFVTPYKAKDLVPLLKKSFLDNPNTSNVVMKNVLEPYGKQGVFTDNLLQGARKAVRKELYGTDEDNVQYTKALKLMLEDKGHKVMVDTTTRKEVLQSMYDVVWAEEKARRKVNKVGQCGKEDMRAYCTQWRDDNSTQLYMELGDPADHLTFLHGLYVAPSTSINGRRRTHQLGEIHLVLPVWHYGQREDGPGNIGNCVWE